MFSYEFCEIFKNICKRLLLYFHYNSHHHYHYHHFHYHCKMHLYCLRILFTIPLDCYMIPCLFQLNIVFSFGIYFSIVLIQAFCFLPTIEGLRICLRPPDKYDALFLLIFTSIYIYIYINFMALLWMGFNSRKARATLK